MIRVLSFVAAAFALAACASPPAAPPYAAATSGTSAGYSETQIESNRYFVTYRAPSGAEAARLEDYALLRAAELTLQNGHEWFWVDRRTLDQQGSSRSSGPSLGVGIGGGSFIFGAANDDARIGFLDDMDEHVRILFLGRL